MKNIPIYEQTLLSNKMYTPPTIDRPPIHLTAQSAVGVGGSGVGEVDGAWEDEPDGQGHGGPCGGWEGGGGGNVCEGG